MCAGPKHHISAALRQRIRFVLFCLRSTLMTESLLLSFPAGTKMLQFPAFPLLSEQFRDPRFNACMQLAVAYRSLPRPSTASKPSHPLYGFQNSLNRSVYQCTTSLPKPHGLGNQLHHPSRNNSGQTLQSVNRRICAARASGHLNLRSHGLGSLRSQLRPFICKHNRLLNF